MDNSGESFETEMIDGEPYSVDDLLWMKDSGPEWEIWYYNLSDMGRWTVDQMLKGKDARAG